MQWEVSSRLWKSGGIGAPIKGQCFQVRLAVLTLTTRFWDGRSQAFLRLSSSFSFFPQLVLGHHLVLMMFIALANVSLRDWCSIGAAKMMKDCTVFREYCHKRNFEGCQTLSLFLHNLPLLNTACHASSSPWLLFDRVVRSHSFRCLRSFQKVKNEHSTLRQKLESYFQVPFSDP